MSRDDAPSVHAILDSAGVAHRLVDHAPTYRARDDAEALGMPPAQVAKTLVTIEHETIRLAVVPASRELDVDRMRAAIGASARLRLATEEEAAAAFPQFEVGAVPPLGRLLGVDEIIDQLVLEQPEVLVNAGDHRHGCLIDPTRLADAAGARIADIARHFDDEERRHRFRDAPPLGHGSGQPGRRTA